MALELTKEELKKNVQNERRYCTITIIIITVIIKNVSYIVRKMAKLYDCHN